MSKKLILLVFVLAFGLTTIAQAATIIWVSDNKGQGSLVPGQAADQGWVDLLRAQGHDVDYRGEDDQSPDYRHWRNMDDAKVAELNAADLVIVSRDISSGGYDQPDDAYWNAVTAPMIVQIGHLARSGDEWFWLPGSGTSARFNPLEAVVPGHDIFNGVGLDGSNQVDILITKGTTDLRVDVVSDATDAGNGTVLAKTDDDLVWIATWEAGQEFYAGSGQTAGGPRMWFAAGSTDSEDGEYNFNAEGEKLFLNAVSYMLGETLDPALAADPSPANGTTVDFSKATPLSWTAGETAARHDVYFGTSFDDVNDADASDTTGIYRGRQNLAPYTPTEALELGMTYYWRIDEVEADNATIHRAGVWSFTVADFLLVDDFEGYQGDEIPVEEQIWGKWHDGIGYGAPPPSPPPYYAGNGTGAEVGDVDTASYTEESITHGGSPQSMPYWYNNKPDKLKYSEAVASVGGPDGLDMGKDWTVQGVKALSLWFRGYPAAVGSFTEGQVGTYTMTAAGADIWGTDDQFHFAFKELSGAGTITAKVESVSDTDPFAKAGVMIRDSLDPNAANTSLVITPGNGVRFQYRNTTGDSTDRVFDDTIEAPYWVKLERTLGGLIRAYYSPDGVDWSRSFDSVPTVVMNPPLHIGLALTSHAPGVQCEAVFSNVTSDGTGAWTAQDIGLTSNEAVPMYVAVANNTGAPAVVYHEDPNATLIDEWTEWAVDLNEIADKGIDLTDVNSIAIGFGDRDNPQPGGAGKMYFDDIGLYPPKCILSKVTDLEADLTGDCVVDYRDLELMVNDWLQADYTVYAETPQAPIAWWKFDNNANDSAGSNNGTPVGNPVYGAGQSGQAITLDGTDYIDCGNPSLLDFATGDWSISAWVKTEMTGTGDANKGVIYAKGGDRAGGIRYGLYVNENQTVQGSIDLVTDDDAAKREAISSVSVSDGEWHHVVGQRDGNTIRVYIDGVVDGVNNTLPDGYDLSGTSQHNAYIGVVTDHAGNVLEKFLVGSIDDVRIYDYALSAPEIMSVMGVSELYNPLTSIANISDEEPANSKAIDFKDFAVLADQWLEERLWPQP